MWNMIKSGWTLAWRQPFAVFALFFYNLLWGIVVYKLVQSVVVPLLQRYPGASGPPQANQIFWIEGQFQLMKTDIVEPYLWTALALLAFRMLLHPVLNAGIYYSLQHTELNAGYRFVDGIRKLTPTYFILYLFQLLLMFAPLYFLVPYVMQQYSTQASWQALSLGLLPGLSAYAIYWFLLQLIFMHLQIGKAAGRSLLFTVIFMLRHLGKAALLGFAVMATAALLSAAATAASLLWAGFIALLGIQIFRFVHMFCKLWVITVQYALWMEKA